MLASIRAARPWLLAALALSACSDDTPTTSPTDSGADDDSALSEGECVTDHDCIYMGPGSMCMDSACMKMDVLGPTVVQPAATDQDISLTPLIDINDDPAIFEGNMEVAIEDVELTPGVLTSAYVYKNATLPGSVPGPLIDVVEGTLVRIHVTNNLPEPTTVHWHGLALPIEMDGVPNMPEPPIEPGESYTYEFEAMYPSLYWYHPHFRSDVQIERGLYGMFVIRPNTPEPVVDVERILSVDDILVDDSGQVEPRDESPAHILNDDGSMGMTFVSMMGRQGNRLLLNGKMNPVINVQGGSVERWRVTNTANSRFFNLSLEGHQLVHVGSDQGFLAAPKVVSELLISPSERVDFLVQMTGNAGQDYAFVTKHYDRGHDMADPGDLPLATVRYSPSALDVNTPMPATATPIEAWIETDPRHIITMGETTVRGGGVAFTLNSEVWPNFTPLVSPFNSGKETWELVNTTHMDHPFHLHGTRFQVSSTGPIGGGLTPETDREWKDTTIVGPESVTRFVTEFVDYPGTWLFHCHIFEHAHGGMMGVVNVE